MQVMPSAVPITKIKSDPTAVLTLIEKGPILLTTRGSGVAVIASLDEWNAIAARLERFERLGRLDGAIREADAGQVVDYEYENPMHT